jgi:hypothetical protein
MKDVVDMRVTQVRLYPTDLLPFFDIRVPSNLKALKEVFGFETVNLDPGGVSFVCQNGAVKVDEQVIPVVSLTVEPRRISLGIRGSSKMADAVYGEFQKLLFSFAGGSKKQDYPPLVKAEDTSCVATLSIDFEDLIASALMKYLHSDVKSALETKSAVPKSVVFKNLTFEIRYAPTDPQLEEHEITMSNKTLVIEPRAATPRKERRFFTSSPVDSDTHLSILRGLEKALTKSNSTRT